MHRMKSINLRPILKIYIVKLVVKAFIILYTLSIIINIITILFFKKLKIIVNNFFIVLEKVVSLRHGQIHCKILPGNKFRVNDSVKIFQYIFQ